MILGIFGWRAVFQPAKICFRCPSFGLVRQDIDAVHCKECGEILTFPTTISTDGKFKTNAELERRTKTAAVIAPAHLCGRCAR